VEPAAKPLFISLREASGRRDSNPRPLDHACHIVAIWTLGLPGQQLTAASRPRGSFCQYPLAGTLHRRRLNASRNAGLLATVHAPRVNCEGELIARPGPVGDAARSTLAGPSSRSRATGSGWSARRFEARRDFLDEGCELKELGENLGFCEGISATHRAPILLLTPR
jgi:hypothetical protein